MKKIQNILLIATGIVVLVGCKNQYLKDYYVAPQASFKTSVNGIVNTLESVIFTNTGTGQTYAIWTGDAKHIYGQANSTGFTIGSSGVFSYSYNEPGTYNVVWIASSIKSDGKVEQSIDSLRLEVKDNTNGIDILSIYKVDRMPAEYNQPSTTYYNANGVFFHDTILCPIIYEAWKDNRIKSKLYLDYRLSSPASSLYCYQTDWTKIRSMTDQNFSVMNGNKIAIQPLKVVTSSGAERIFQLAAVIIPKLTEFSINGVKATIKHEVSTYNVYDVTLTLPKGTDLSALQPVWILMDDNVNLLDGTNASVKVNGVEQKSGMSVVDFSKGVVTYDLSYQMLGETNSNMSRTAQMKVDVQVAQ